MSDETKVTLKSQIKDQLEKTGTLSGHDLQNIMTRVAQDAPPPAAGQPAAPDPLKTDDKIKAGSESVDGLTNAGSDNAIDKAVAEDLVRSENPNDIFGVTDDLETITITAADKKRFMDAFVDGKRFTRPFEMFGGSVKGIFRSRKTGETRAILDELVRQAQVNNHSMLEHSAKIRHALLHCQLAEKNGVVRKELEGPLKAMEEIDTTSKKVRVVPPKWSEEMEVLFDSMDEGMVNALYKELRTFEKVYWTLISNASDQNFWAPEDSTIE